MKKTLAELAEMIGGTVSGDASVTIDGVAGIREARPGQLTFLANPKYERYLETTAASAVVVSPEHREAGESVGRPLLVCRNPYGAFARAMELFAGPRAVVERGVHPTAVVSDSASLGADVAVGACAVIMERATIHDRVVIHPGVYVGPGVEVGEDTVLYPNASIKAASVLGERVIVHSGSVIGSDGFGFASENGEHRKVPQIGNVVIEDDVEIGANVCIDRATTGTTLVSRGTKIDNLVQIGHNVVVGEGSIVVAQVGISGSTELGRNVVVGGQAGLAGHITIGDRAMIGAQAGVTRDVPPGERVSGYPARKHSQAKRLLACIARLPDLIRKVSELERRLDSLDEGEDR
ncbi:MAG: UDP-3-O-(3-hydroxymyristoyl)glucosamine N-acyltransferase [Candidatus Eisenbacteria bacterium]|nr:UDP-3-O-(3-hydroxymyristoyl)glucosamine N-acyltransferase [Candidatus Eisenbacteria bacterium]